MWEISVMAACGIPHHAARRAIDCFPEAILVHHAKPLARLTVALARQEQMTGTEIAALMPRSVGLR
jgi:hypothetical protein